MSSCSHSKRNGLLCFVFGKGVFMKAFLRYVLMGAFLSGAFGTATQALASEYLTDDEYRASVCAIASQGAFTAGVARQKDLPKEEAKKMLEARLEVLGQSFSSRIFVLQIAEVWYTDLHRIYTMDILPTSEEKATFATMLEELSFSACMNKEPNIAL